ncbi:Hypothetical predicted protein [Scomber scombrus]|uniref:Uncharacterized protein n=1 Tax=Scomber scombrus TaxID=13677 RepID=A0AAV1NWR1_SCOSC
MKPYEHISILLTWEGNWTQGNASGAATRDGTLLYLVLELQTCRKMILAVLSCIVLLRPKV